MKWLLRGAGLAAIVVAAVYIRLQAVFTSVPTPPWRCQLLPPPRARRVTSSHTCTQPPKVPNRTPPGLGPTHCPAPSDPARVPASSRPVYARGFRNGSPCPAAPTVEDTPDPTSVPHSRKRPPPEPCTGPTRGSRGTGLPARPQVRPGDPRVRPVVQLPGDPVPR